jgi:signal peptidase I
VIASKAMTTKVPSRNPGRRLRWVLLAAITLALVALPLRNSFRAVLVVGSSMQPTLNSGDLVLVAVHAYEHAVPLRDDLVVARYLGDLIVKRVVGLPGEQIEVRNGQLWINEHPVPENHAVCPGQLTLSPGRLLRDRFALLGDNRDVPAAQTIHAVVPPEAIMGKVVLRLHWPRRPTA